MAPVLLIFVMAMGVMGVVLTATVTRADDDGMAERYKYYKSIYIEKNMTLWDIAHEYAGMEYETMEQYIQEVTAINHIKDPDHIEYGTKISIPYYSEEYK